MTSDSSDYDSLLKYEIFDQNKVVSIQIIAVFTGLSTNLITGYISTVEQETRSKREQS